MNNQYPLPEHVLFLLDQDVVNKLLREIAYVLTEHYDCRHPELDSPWVDGTGIYGRVQQHMKNMHAEQRYPWFKMHTMTMDYVFSVFGVPMQFTKDCILKPSKKHRLMMNAPEYHQYRLFADTEPETEIKWRVMVEPLHDDEELAPSWRIALVGFNQYQAIVAMQSIDSLVVLAPVSAVSEELSEAKDIDVAPVFRRRSDEQEGNGTD
ncbi:hypothetical protein [Aeromonas sp. R6-2]|uniref:hypothetical protein n=1 Tax=unclassified Aeromonas TaxID=257493 RepID=UPI0034A2B1D7